LKRSPALVASEDLVFVEFLLMHIEVGFAFGADCHVFPPSGPPGNWQGSVNIFRISQGCRQVLLLRVSMSISRHCTKMTLIVLIVLLMLGAPPCVASNDGSIPDGYSCRNNGNV